MSFNYSQVSHNNVSCQVKSFSYYESCAIQLTNAEQLVFEYISRFCLRYQRVDVSQIRIALDLKYCRQTVNEAIAKLTKIGFISKTTRYKKTCFYFLDKFFRDINNRTRLSFIFKSFKALFNVSLLCMKEISDRNKPNPTLISLFNIFKSNVLGKKTIIEEEGRVFGQNRSKKREIHLSTSNRRLNEVNSSGMKNEIVSVKAPRSKNIGYSPYDFWQAPKKDVINVQIARVMRDIRKYMEMLADPEAYIPANMFMTMAEQIMCIENMLKGSLKELKQLEDQEE